MAEAVGGLSSLEKIGQQAIDMVIEIFVGFIDLIVSALVDALIWLFHTALMKPLISEFIGEFMINEKILSLKETEIMGLLLNYCYQKMQLIAFSAVILIASWQLFKIYFSYFGTTATEEGWKIGGKFIIFGVLVFKSKEICLFAIKIFTGMAEQIGGIALTVSETNSIGSTMKEAIVSIFDILENTEFSRLETYGELVKFCLILAIDIKLLKIAIDIAEKYMNLVLMIVISPLAFACGVTKATNKYLTKWVSFFSSGILYQLLQYTMIAMLYFVTNKVTTKVTGGGLLFENATKYVLEGTDAFRLLFIVWGILSIGQNAVSIIDELGFSSLGEGATQLSSFVEMIPTKDFDTKQRGTDGSDGEDGIGASLRLDGGTSGEASSRFET